MSNLQRVSKKDPCAVCGKDSWCMIGDTAALCMRVTSDRPFTMKNGDIGHWHDSGAPRQWTPKSESIKESPSIDASGMIDDWARDTKHSWVDDMAENLGLDALAVSRLGPVWSEKWQSWAWPMTSGIGKVCGIRLRYDNGRKLAVTGSKQGLFIPAGEAARRVFMPEGPTDTAALLSLGVYSIGRPSASGGILDIKQTIDRLRIRELVIVADNDEDKYTPDNRKFNPGYDGAKSIQNHINIPSCIITLPTKDAREFVQEGGTKESLEYIVRSAVWTTISQSLGPPDCKSRGID